MLYICKVYKKTVYSLWGRQVIVHEEKARLRCLPYEALTETTMVKPIVTLLPFALVHVAFLRYLIVTLHLSLYILLETLSWSRLYLHCHLSLHYSLVNETAYLVSL